MRVSFFIPEYPCDLPPPLLNRCDPPVSGVRTGYIRIFNIGALALMKRPLPITRTATRDLFDIVTLVQCGVVSHVLIFEWHTAYALRGKPVRKVQAVFVMVRSACTEGAIGGRPGYPILLTCLGLLEADRRILKVL